MEAAEEPRQVVGARASEPSTHGVTHFVGRLRRKPLHIGLVLFLLAAAFALRCFAAQIVLWTGITVVLLHAWKFDGIRSAIALGAALLMVTAVVYVSSGWSESRYSRAYVEAGLAARTYIKVLVQQTYQPYNDMQVAAARIKSDAAFESLRVTPTPLHMGYVRTCVVGYERAISDFGEALISFEAGAVKGDAVIAAHENVMLYWGDNPALARGRCDLALSTAIALGKPITWLKKKFDQ